MSSLQIHHSRVFSLFLLITLATAYYEDTRVKQCQKWNINDPKFTFKVENDKSVACSWIEGARTLTEVQSRRKQHCDKSKLIRKLCPHSCGKCCVVEVRKRDDQEKCYNSQVCEGLITREHGIQDYESTRVSYEATINANEAKLINKDVKASIVKELDTLYKTGIVGCDYEASEIQSDAFTETSIIDVEFLDFSSDACEDDATSCVKVNGVANVSFVKKEDGSIASEDGIITTLQQYYDDFQSVIQDKFDDVVTMQVSFATPTFVCKTITDSPDINVVDILVSFVASNDVNEDKSLRTMNQELCPDEQRKLELIESDLDSNLDIVGVEFLSLQKEDHGCDEGTCRYISSGTVYFNGYEEDNSAFIEETSQLLTNALPADIQLGEVTLLQSLQPGGSNNYESPEFIQVKGKEELLNAGAMYVMVGFAFVALQAALFVILGKKLSRNGDQSSSIGSDMENIGDDTSSNGFKPSYIVDFENTSSTCSPIDKSKIDGLRVNNVNILSFPLNNLDSYEVKDDSFYGGHNVPCSETNIECIASPQEYKKKSRFDGLRTALWR